MKLPRDVSGDRCVKTLARLGFVRVRQTGSHVRLVRGSLAITVPNHPVLAPGTLASILKQAGVTNEEFLNAL